MLSIELRKLHVLQIQNPYLRGFIGEMVGTFVLVLLGSGCLAQHILGDERRLQYGSLITVSMGWGFAITAGVFIAGHSGEGHINPAITLAMAITGRTEWLRVPFYMAGQYLGAFIGSAILYGMYYERIYIMEMLFQERFHRGEQWTRMNLSLTGVIFVTTPNKVTNYTAFFDQLISTALLAGGILAIVDTKNFNVPTWCQPLYVGFLGFSVLNAFSLNADGAINPARDFSPRVMLSIVGYGSEPFTYQDCFFWIPVIGPHVGAIVGMLGYDLLIGIHLSAPPESLDSPDMKGIKMRASPVVSPSGACEKDDEANRKSESFF